ncbi:hypothetical protein C8R47DRAFT_1073906 [Mycena vitilis]|nr:hypothetical protein C8R47DRAFT_1073906 [Mycena vitilis]
MVMAAITFYHPTLAKRSKNPPAALPAIVPRAQLLILKTGYYPKTTRNGTWVYMIIFFSFDGFLLRESHRTLLLTSARAGEPDLVHDGYRLRLINGVSRGSQLSPPPANVTVFLRAHEQAGCAGLFQLPRAQSQGVQHSLLQLGSTLTSWISAYTKLAGHRYLATEKQQKRSRRKSGPRRARPRPLPSSPQEPVTPHDNDNFSAGRFGQAPFEAETSQSPVTPVYPVLLTTTPYDRALAPHYDGVSYAAPPYPPPSHQHDLAGTYCGPYTASQNEIQPQALPYSFSTLTFDLATPTVYPPIPAHNGDFYGWNDSLDYSAGWSDSPDYSDYGSWTDSPEHAAYVWGQEVPDSCLDPVFEHDCIPHETQSMRHTLSAGPIIAL